MIWHKRGTQKGARFDEHVAGVHLVCWHIQTYKLW